MSFAQVHRTPVQALFIKAVPPQSTAEHVWAGDSERWGLLLPGATRQGNVIDSSLFAKAGWGSRAALFYSSCSETEGKPNESHMAEQITVRVADVPQSGKHNLYRV